MEELKKKINYWVFVIRLWDKLTVGDLFNRMMKNKFLGLYERTPNRKNIEKGDKVVFYIKTPIKSFVGTATLASRFFSPTEIQKQQYLKVDKDLYVDCGVLLEDVDQWDNKVPAENAIHQLSFIENKKNWGAYFQGGVRQITEEDFITISGQREISRVERIVTSKDIESQAEFALEAHLEEFIYENWQKINWGSKLELYKTEEQDGRQFPAGTWSIDFLAIDKSTNDLVVIELKRGKTSDAAVGQVQRYINWVKDNVADAAQNVRGIIIAKEVDEALKYGVQNLDYVDVKTYKVDFELFSFAK